MSNLDIILNPNPRVVGSKYHDDGIIRSFPGISVVCHIPKNDPSYSPLCELQNHISNSEFGSYFKMLPPSSLHMTVKDLVCDEVRVEEDWSDKISLDTPWVEVEQFMWENVKPMLPTCSFSMKFRRLWHSKITIALALEPTCRDTNSTIRNLRDCISEISGVKHPNHADYIFHISLCYLLEDLSEETYQEIEVFLSKTFHDFAPKFSDMIIKNPKLVFFPDMESFPEQPLIYKP